MAGTDSVGGICTGFEKTCCPEPAVKAYTVVVFTRRHDQDLSLKALCVGAQKTDDKIGSFPLWVFIREVYRVRCIDDEFVGDSSREGVGHG